MKCNWFTIFKRKFSKFRLQPYWYFSTLKLMAGTYAQHVDVFIFSQHIVNSNFKSLG